MNSAPSLPARSWLNWPARVRRALSCRVPAQPRPWRLALLTALLGVALAALAPASPLKADNWRASLCDEGLPSHLVAVDKQRQTFLFYEKKSPFRLKYAYPCVTGQLPGDKQVRNDLRTPEGIYFVEYKIASGLDFEEYGGIAYTLNYPNPVDRLRGKTGHGIWIHSKGYGLVPTRGCVAIGLEDIGQVGPQLVPGTAVVLAQHLNDTPTLKADDGTARQLRRLMHDWSEAWAGRSAAMFDFYDASSYSRGTEDFDAFRRNKERLFRILDFIKIYNREIHVLEGPGYWVTWAEQFYTASNLSTEGVRRLYWQRGADKKFRIVGMEWTPRDLGMRADFQKGRLVAWAAPAVLTDANSEMPRLPRLDMPETAAAPADNAGTSQTTAIAPPASTAKGLPGAAAPARPASATNTSPQQKPAAVQVAALSEPLVPRPMPVAPPAEIEWGQGRSMTMPAVPSPAPREVPQPTAAITPEAASAPAAVPAENQPAMQTDRASDTASSAALPAPAESNSLQLDDANRAAVFMAVRGWSQALASRSGDISRFYAPDRYNRASGTPRGPSFQTVQREFARLFRSPGLLLIQKEARLRLAGEHIVSECPELLATASGVRQGLRSLWWERGADGEFRIVASAFAEGDQDLAALYLDAVSTAVSADIEVWRKAWENARIDAYMDCYTQDAVQQNRRGHQQIRHQKAGLWSRVRPVLVQLSGLRLSMDRQGIRADMTQVYADSVGRGDRGIKTLHLRYDGRHWRIQREDWSADTPAPEGSVR